MTAATVKALVASAPKFSTKGEQAEPAPLPFDVVPIADLAHSAPAAPLFAWEGLVPLDHVTNLSAHGGTGKTILTLMLGICTALGRPLFNLSTREGNVAFFSGEDGAHRLRYLLHFICGCMGVAVEDLEGKLHILDAASRDPVLFTEVAAPGQREGYTTPTYDALREYMQAHAITLLIVDNASDVYAASEIARAQVRGFMRSLAKLAREFHAAVILLAHVDKGTSRQERSGTEGYSGSTAWHNSARSRLFMRREADGSLVIEHQKHNLGPMRAPMRLRWPEGGIPELDQPLGPVVQGIADRSHEKALLRLIAEFSARGEHVSAAVTAKTNAPALLGRERHYPKIKPAEVFDLLRQAERAGWLTRAEVRTENRKTKEVWSVTDSGRQFASLPPAPSSVRALTPHTPRAEDGAHGAPLAPAAPAAPSWGDGAHGADGAGAPA
jgi:putative DNA primase/helicase